MLGVKFFYFIDFFLPNLRCLPFWWVFELVYWAKLWLKGIIRKKRSNIGAGWLLVAAAIKMWNGVKTSRPGLSEIQFELWFLSCKYLRASYRSKNLQQTHKKKTPWPRESLNSLQHKSGKQSEEWFLGLVKVWVKQAFHSSAWKHESGHAHSVFPQTSRQLISTEYTTILNHLSSFHSFLSCPKCSLTLPTTTHSHTHTYTCACICLYKWMLVRCSALVSVFSPFGKSWSVVMYMETFKTTSYSHGLH